MTLNALFDKYGTDKGASLHDLGDIYEPYFQSIKGRGVIEIGVLEGASLNALSEFFGQRSKIVGIDCNDKSQLQLSNQTAILKKRLHKKGVTLDTILPDAFAVVREMATRVIGECVEQCVTENRASPNSVCACRSDYLRTFLSNGCEQCELPRSFAYDVFPAPSGGSGVSERSFSSNRLRLYDQRWSQSI
jgi:hypothetical protein